MTRTAIFVDVSNLYYCIGRKFESRKLDYQKLWNFAEQTGTIQRATAYGSQVKNEALGFITCLKKIGYDINYKEVKQDDKQIRRSDLEVNIAVDIVRIIDRVDRVILCSQNPAYIPIIQWVKDKGVRIVILGCGITREIKDNVDQWIEIEESLLETKE
jgi:uncharacterized LabA/DUF88 family protein